MKTKAVKVAVDVHCEWTGEPPRYRLYVNKELFTERTWIWKEFYLEELIQIEAPPGKYMIDYQLLGQDAVLRTKNARVESGSAVMHKHMVLEIL